MLAQLDGGHDSNKDETMSLTRIFSGVLGVLFASVAPVFAMWFVPAYRTIHESLSTGLPILTASYLYYSFLLWLLPLAVIVMAFRWPKTRWGEWIACLAGFVGMLVSVALCVVAMYLPAFGAA
ncbi:hypothetical protein [Pseudomonas sp.]|uniref:hypothetical protein n=2 Tax=unclassified Pseudomonas TaxID=196821 RepID=UPI003D141872